MKKSRTALTVTLAVATGTAAFSLIGCTSSAPSVVYGPPFTGNDTPQEIQDVYGPPPDGGAFGNADDVETDPQLIEVVYGPPPTADEAFRVSADGN